MEKEHNVRWGGRWTGKKSEGWCRGEWPAYLSQSMLMYSISLSRSYFLSLGLSLSITIVIHKVNHPPSPPLSVLSTITISRVPLNSSSTSKCPFHPDVHHKYLLFTKMPCQFSVIPQEEERWPVAALLRETGERTQSRLGDAPAAF